MARSGRHLIERLRELVVETEGKSWGPASLSSIELFESSLQRQFPSSLRDWLAECDGVLLDDCAVLGVCSHNGSETIQRAMRDEWQQLNWIPNCMLSWA